MSLYNVRKSNSGFTLVELLMTLIIVGVIAALTAPNFLGLLSRNRVNEATLQVEGALKEAQRQAMRRGKQCTINIDTTSKIISNPATNGCLLSNRNLNSSVNFNSSRNAITFSGKGNITIDGANPTPVLVISMPSRVSDQKCVVIEGFLGVQRTGNYLGNITAQPASDSCQ